MAKQILTTPKGEAFYAHIRKTETFQGNDSGKYTIQLKMSQKDTDEFITHLKKELKAIQADPQYKGKRWMKEPHMGIKEREDGTILIKFATKAVINEVKRTIPVFDATGKPYKGEIGNESIVKIGYNIGALYMSSTVNGLVLYLEAIQVLDLKTYSPDADASAFGFGVEEGFTVGDEDENPFGEEDTAEEAEEGDEQDF